MLRYPFVLWKNDTLKQVPRWCRCVGGYRRELKKWVAESYDDITTRDRGFPFWSQLPFVLRSRQTLLARPRDFSSFLFAERDGLLLLHI